MSEQRDAFAVQDLDAVLRALSGGASELDGLAGRTGEVPDAGSSSADIAATMAAIAGAASAIVRSAESAGGRVRASAGSYAELDNGPGGRFQ